MLRIKAQSIGSIQSVSWTQLCLARDWPRCTNLADQNQPIKSYDHFPASFCNISILSGFYFFIQFPASEQTNWTIYVAQHHCPYPTWWVMDLKLAAKYLWTSGEMEATAGQASDWWIENRLRLWVLYVCAGRNAQVSWIEFQVLFSIWSNHTAWNMFMGPWKGKW